MTRRPRAMLALGALAATIATVPVAAEAQYPDSYDRPTYGYGGYRNTPAYRGGYGNRRVDYDRGYRPGSDYGRHDRCRSDRSGGALIGAIAGGLLGNAVAGYGDRAAGTILGGVGGAIAGRPIDRDC